MALLSEGERRVVKAAGGKANPALRGSRSGEVLGKALAKLRGARKKASKRGTVYRIKPEQLFQSWMGKAAKDEIKRHRSK